MKSHIDKSRDVTVTDMGETISVFVPISWKRTGGRKQIVLPDEASDGTDAEEKPSPLAIALARAYVWQKWIDEGKYANAKELAQDIGMDPAFVRRVLRLSAISPARIEYAMKNSECILSMEKENTPLLWRLDSVGSYEEELNA